MPRRGKKEKEQKQAEQRGRGRGQKMRPAQLDCHGRIMKALNASSKRAFLPLTACTCSVMSDSVTPWTVACQAPLSIGFPKQEYWSGLPFPSPGDLSEPGIELASPALAGGFFTTKPPGKPILTIWSARVFHPVALLKLMFL